MANTGEELESRLAEIKVREEEDTVGEDERSYSVKENHIDVNNKELSEADNVMQFDGNENKTVETIEADSMAVSDGQIETAEGLDCSSDDHSLYGDAQCVEDECENSPRTDEEWSSEKKQIFILSESGKPIYSRYGREDKLVTLSGLLVTLVSHVAEDGDELHCVEAGGHTVAFLVRSPLILAAVDAAAASHAQLSRQLRLLCAQLEAVSTRATLVNAFQQRASRDLRYFTGGCSRLLDSLAQQQETDGGLLLADCPEDACPVQCLPLPSQARAEIGSVLCGALGKVTDALFGVLVVGRRVACAVRRRGTRLCHDDLLLLCNLVNSTDSLRSSEHWMPICLPNFDPSGYLYAHVSYLSDDCDACLFLMTVQRNYFTELSAVRTKIVEKLRKQNVLDKLKNLPPPTPNLNPPALPISTPDADEALQSAGLDVRHFVYKLRALNQYTCGPPSPVYRRDPRQPVRLYASLHQQMHEGGKELKFVYRSDPLQASVGVLTEEHELLCLLEPLASKQAAMAAVNRLLRWLRQEEGRLFAPHQPTF